MWLQTCIRVVGVRIIIALRSRPAAVGYQQCRYSPSRDDSLSMSLHLAYTEMLGFLVGFCVGLLITPLNPRLAVSWTFSA
jgi:hypothetical protein